MAYTTKALVENYLQRDLSENEIAFLVALLPAVKQWIDRNTNSNFDTATATTRYYDGGECSLDINPCQTITAVSALSSIDNSINYTYVAIQDYITEPVNETVKREIRRRYGRFPTGIANIAVTATFTEYESGVPQDIQTVATRMIASILEGTADDVQSGGIKRESIEGHTLDYATSVDSFDKLLTGDPVIRTILEQRRDLYLG